MSVAVVTGAASGIGQATRQRLEADGWRVIGVDLHDSEIVADLATPEGRAHMVEKVSVEVDALHGVVACAGVTGRTNPSDLVVRLNYFGAVATLDGLRPLLAQGAPSAAVAISSNAATTGTIDPEALELLLEGEEEAAAAHGYESGIAAYATAKLGLARWVRRQAVTYEWVGSGVRLNAVAPGVVLTAMTADSMNEINATIGYPRPTREPAHPDEIAGLVAYLLSDQARYVVGSFMVIDGGTDAALRPDM
jgi:NAD(P)-dependent dehydrogenase (short-subunit alcohol dehydrogenase family)